MTPRVAHQALFAFNLAIFDVAHSFQILPQAAPAHTEPAVLARGVPAQTAGYIGGNPNSPLTCPGTSTFSFGPEYPFGCCDSTSCHKPATCVIPGKPTCGPNCVYSQITTCTDTASPTCASWILATGPDDNGSAHVSFGCVATGPTKITAFVSPTATVSSAGSSQISVVSSTPLSSSSSLSSLSTNDGGQSSPSPLTTTTVSSRSSGAADGSGSSIIATQTSTIPSASSTGDGGDGGGGGGLSEENKVAIAVGLGVGIPAVTVAFVQWQFPRWRFPCFR